MLEQVPPTNEIVLKLTAVNRLLFLMMLVSAAKAQRCNVSALIADKTLENYLSGSKRIPLHCLDHLAQLAGRRSELAWYVNRLNYLFRTHHDDPSWSHRFLSRIERFMRRELLRLDFGPV
jgi:hypothetical protein